MKSLWFSRLIRLELILIFLVILAGSVVRMTGSGMGCPDWPKCFGYMIPPTEESQVLWAPEKEYQEGQMIVYNEAMYSAETTFTSGDTYNPSNWEKYEKHDYAIFNATHTWIEYINRLLGALSGIPMVLLVVLSLRHIRKKPLYFVLSLAGLFLLGFEAWLGKEVVDGNLIPGSITIHMLGAFSIVILMVIFGALVSDKNKSQLPFSKGWIFAALGLMLIQTVLGTQVREQVDELTKEFGDNATREGWIAKIDYLIYVHRSASLLVTGLILYLWWKVKKASIQVPSMQWAAFLVLLSTLTGAILFYFDIPKVLQPVHLLLSAGIIAFLTQAAMMRRKVS